MYPGQVAAGHERPFVRGKTSRVESSAGLIDCVSRLTFGPDSSTLDHL
jgi:hypothetical protein